MQQAPKLRNVIGVYFRDTVSANSAEYTALRCVRKQSLNVIQENLTDNAPAVYNRGIGVNRQYSTTVVNENCLAKSGISIVKRHHARGHYEGRC